MNWLGRWRPQFKVSVNHLTLLGLFLSLGFLLLFLLILLDAGAEPKGGQGTSPVAVSAQGFVGLRELIKARGGQAGLNRQMGGQDRIMGDVAVITLPTGIESGNGTIEFRRNEAANTHTTTSNVAQSVDDFKAQNRFYIVPSADRSRAIFPQPAATKAVLIVLPKWNAEVSSQHLRFAKNPSLIAQDTMDNLLAYLSPITQLPLYETDPRLKDMHYYHPDKVYDYSTGTKGFVSAQNELIVFDMTAYDLRRAANHKWVKRRDTLSAPDYDNTPAHLQFLDEVIDVETTLPLTVKIAPSSGGKPLDVGVISGLQTIAGANLEPVIMASNGQPVLSRLKVLDGPTGPRTQPAVPIYVLSEPDLLNNQILSDPKKVVAAMTILETVAGQPVSKTSFVFDGTFNGLGVELDLFHRLSAPPFMGIILSILILGLGLIWIAFVRFGVPQVVTKRAALGQGIRVLADNTARLMAVALKDSQLGPYYARHIRDTVLRGQRVGLKSGGLSADEAAERLSQIYKTSHRFKDLNDRAARPLNGLEMLKLCSDLHHWKTECQSAHR